PTPRMLVMSRRSHLGVGLDVVSASVCGSVPERAPAMHIEVALRTMWECQSVAGTRECKRCPLQGSMAMPRLPLTRSEYAVFVYIGQGWSNQRIALATDRSVKTIESHRESIKRKLGL